MLAAAVYTVYLIHVFPVVGLQLALVSSSMPPLAKFAMVTLIAVPVSFALALGLQRLPDFRRVVGEGA